MPSNFPIAPAPPARSDRRWISPAFGQTLHLASVEVQIEP
jgi:hypothetical protein